MLTDIKVTADDTTKHMYHDYDNINSSSKSKQANGFNMTKYTVQSSKLNNEKARPVFNGAIKWGKNKQENTKRV